MKKQIKTRAVPQGLSVLERIFNSRGIELKDALPALKTMANPESMKGLAAAAASLKQAIERKETIVVVADYDCDGASACAIMMRGLKMLGASSECIHFHVPDRQRDGYGLTPSIVEQVKERHNPKMIITVDNGISSFAGVDKAVQYGIDVIVTDHHLPGLLDGVVALPSNCIVVDPSQPNCAFPSKALCGAGVAFYLMVMLRKLIRDDGGYKDKPEPAINQLLQLVALATIADVVALDANNRCLVNAGLQLIRSDDAFEGIKALFAVASKTHKKASSIDLGFLVGPRINAAGRMADMTIGISALTCDDAVQAKAFAQQLHDINVERRSVEAAMLKESEDVLKTLVADTQSSSIVVYGENFHEGVVGIVAGKLKEEHYKPTFVFAKSLTGELKGSGRSIPGFHLKDALDWIAKQHPGLLIKFGGHSMAAGCTIRADGANEFKNALQTISSLWLTPEALTGVLLTDGSLDPFEFSVSMAEKIDSYVWGQGFESPVFMDEATILNQRVLNGKHLKLTIDVKGQKRDGIWFFREEPLECKSKIKLAYRLSVNEWNGQRSPQFMVEACD